MLYGWTAEEIMGRNAAEFMYRKDPDRLVAMRQEVLERGEWSGEVHQLTKSGKEIVVEGRWTLVRDNNDQPKSILSINTDVTEKKKLEAQFLRAQRMESIGTLAGGIAHDLNNVLGPILLAVELLRAKIDDPQSQNLLKMMETNVQRGSGMVRQVLSFARGTDGERAPLQLRYIITDIEKMLADTLPRSIQIHTDVVKGLWTINGDSTQVHQVLMNLCVNARDAMPQGGSLDIQAENLIIDEHFARVNPDAHLGPYVAISVADSGTGMYAPGGTAWFCIQDMAF